MIDGKNKYNDIQVPEGLEQVFDKACKRGKRTVIMRKVSKGTAVVAACFCLVLLTGNETVYATFSEIPLIGNVIQFFHSGQGGTITDGASGYLESVNGTLQVRFDSESNFAPHYDIQYMTMPNRIQITLDGVRNFDRDELQEIAGRTEGIRDMYFVTYLDDSAVRFVIELEDGIDYNVKEYEQPGYLEIAFVPAQQLSDGKHWILRSESMEMGETLALMQEAYDNQGANIVKTEAGKYTVVMGPFASEEEASNALGEINDKAFTVEDLTMGRPK